jgi:hypothetical protein
MTHALLQGEIAVGVSVTLCTAVGATIVVSVFVRYCNFVFFCFELSEKQRFSIFTKQTKKQPFFSNQY